MKKCGFVTIMGRPNVGKSTLLNGLLNIHLAINLNQSQQVMSRCQDSHRKNIIIMNLF